MSLRNSLFAASLLIFLSFSCERIEQNDSCVKSLDSLNAQHRLELDSLSTALYIVKGEKQELEQNKASLQDSVDLLALKLKKMGNPVIDNVRPEFIPLENK